MWKVWQSIRVYREDPEWRYRKKEFRDWVKACGAPGHPVGVRGHHVKHVREGWVPGPAGGRGARRIAGTTTVPASRPRSPRIFSSRAYAPTPRTDMAARASGCRSRGAWPGRLVVR